MRASATFLLVLAVACGSGEPELVSRSSAVTSSATCDGRWHWVDVAGAVCGDASPTGFQYVCRTGSASSPLVVFLQRGGACLSGDTCFCPGGNCTGRTIDRNHFGLADSFDGQPFAESAFGKAAMYGGETSPFGGWNFAFVPYCTGDIHAGNAVRDYTTSDGTTFSFSHKGFSNVGLDLARIQSIFTPRTAVLTGNSAGGYGADCNLARVRAALPQTAFELNVVGGPISPRDSTLVPTAGLLWGAWAPRSDGSPQPLTCPLPDDATVWSTGEIIRYNSARFPDVRKGLIEDYDDATISFFACLLGGGPDCRNSLRHGMMDAFSQSIGPVNPSYKIYFHEGQCHDERIQDGNAVSSCDYDVMAEQNVLFKDWLRGFMQVPGFAWGNVL